MIEEFRKIDFFKIGVLDEDLNYDYYVSNVGRVKKVSKTKEKFVGFFNEEKKEFYFKYCGKKIPIKFALCSCFFENYVHKKYKIVFIDGNHANLNIENIKLEVFKKDMFEVPKDDIISLFEFYLLSGSLKKMIFKCANKYSFKYNKIYSEDDVFQECISYCWSKLYLFNYKEEFELFLYGKIKDCLIDIIRRKIKENEIFNFNLDTLFSKYENLDKNKILMVLF